LTWSAREPKLIFGAKGARILTEINRLPHPGAKYPPNFTSVKAIPGYLTQKGGDSMQMGEGWRFQTLSERSWFVQEMLEVPHSMHNGDDLDGPGFRTIDNNEIGLTRHCPEPDRLCGDLSAFGSEQWVPSQTVAGSQNG
jgi:hypothetical protein